MVKMLLLWFNHRRQVVGNYLIRRFYKASPDAVFGEEGVGGVSCSWRGHWGSKTPTFDVNEVGWLELPQKKSMN